MEGEDRPTKKQRRLSRATVSNSSSTDLSRDDTDDSVESGSSESAMEQKPSLARTPRFRADGKTFAKKGSLIEAELIEAKMKTRSAKEKGNKMTEDEKKAQKRAANRLSAFQSRQRRKIMIEELKKTVSEQSKNMSEQMRENTHLKSQLKSVCKVNEVLRCQVAAATGLHTTATANPNNTLYSSDLGNFLVEGAVSQPLQSSISAQSQRPTSLAAAQKPKHVPADNLGLLTKLAVIQQLQGLQPQLLQQQQQHQQQQQQQQKQQIRLQLQLQQQLRLQRDVSPETAPSSGATEASARSVGHSPAEIAQLQRQRNFEASNSKENKNN